MPLIIDSNVEITPEMLSTLEVLQFNDNKCLLLYTSHCDTLLTLLFNPEDPKLKPEAKNQILDLAKTTHELRLLLESLKAPITN